MLFHAELKKIIPIATVIVLHFIAIDKSRALGPNGQDNPLQINLTAHKTQIQPGENFEIRAELFLPKGYRAYSDKFHLKIISPEGFQTGNLKIEPEKIFFDKVSRKNKMGIVEQASLRAIIEAPAHAKPGASQLFATLSYQACTDAFCLFPTELEFEIPVNITGHEQEQDSISGFLDFSLAMKKGILWAFVIAFVSGFLTSLTPCIFPIIPITISVLGRHAHLHSRRKNFYLSNLYVLGIAITYASLGVFAAATGAMFGSFMSHPIVLSVICIVFFVMALSMFGLFELQAPYFIRKRFSGDLQIHGYSSAFIYGVIAGIVAGPCVGPVLVGILTFVAKTQNLWIGFWLLFTFAVGMGQLFLLIGFSSQMTKLLPKSGAWMNTIKNIFGLMMMSAFYYYLSLLLQIRFWDIALGAGLIVYGSIFGAFESVQNLSLMKKLKKGICQTIIFLGAAFVTIGIFNLRGQMFLAKSIATSEQHENMWQNFSAEAFANALQNKKPIIIDFWAEWCGACHELDQYTFQSPQFIELAKNFTLLKFDATKDSNQLTALKKKYEIVGLPTIIFYDSTNAQRKDLTVTEFMEAPLFVERMKKALQK